MEMIIFRKISARTRRALNEENDDVDEITELFQGDVKKKLTFSCCRYLFDTST